MSDPYRIEREGPVAILMLARPERLNAFDPDTMRAWREIAEGLLEDASVKALVIMGEGRAFCAGGDIKAMAQASDLKTHFRAMTENHHALVRLLRLAPKPVVTAANGAIAGGGCGLFLAGDWRLAAESATFSPAFLKLGVSPDGGITHLLPRLVGVARSQEILYSERVLDAAALEEMHLAHEVVSSADLRARALEAAVRLAALPPFAFESTKSLLQMTYDNPLSMQLAEERNLNGKSGATSEVKDRLAAFLAKR